MAQELSGRVAIVTGAATGIGKAIAADRLRLGEAALPVDTMLALGVALYVARRPHEARESLEAAVAHAERGERAGKILVTPNGPIR